MEVSHKSDLLSPGDRYVTSFSALHFCPTPLDLWAPRTCWLMLCWLTSCSFSPTQLILKKEYSTAPGFVKGGWEKQAYWRLYIQSASTLEFFRKLQRVKKKKHKLENLHLAVIRENASCSISCLLNKSNYVVWDPPVGSPGADFFLLSKFPAFICSWNSACQ